MSLFEDKSYQSLVNGLDLAWMKQKVHSNNIANSETPGFKTKNVEFKEILSKAEEGKKASWEQKAVVTTDDSTSSRPDGNNVNVDKEELEMWQAYAQYSALSQRLAGKLSSLRYVINNTAK